jgi:dTDP-4-amino-4,6-dideoxygalactose transaminase
VTTPRPHEIWPPPATESELLELARQRNEDISIKGRTGPIRRFEDEFLAFLEDRLTYAVTFNSGTSALLAAYFALGVADGAEVIGPALTYHAALSPVYTLGGSAVLVDIDPESRCIDPARIEAAISDRTRAITVVHQWGHPADMDRILTIADRHGLRVVEDCSHAHGSRYRGRLCGTFGHVGVFSLQANKAIFAGEGGILVTSDAEVHDRAVLLGHYRDRSRDAVDGDLREYWVTGAGLKLRMSPFNAIVASYSLRAFPEVVDARHKCMNYLRERLTEVDYLEPVSIRPEAYMGGWYGMKPLYRPEVLGGLLKPRLIAALQAEGAEVTDPSGPSLNTLPLYTRSPDHLYPGRRKVVNRAADTPIAVDVRERSLSLPTFSNWPGDVSVIDQYIEAFSKIRKHHRELLNDIRG